jgi:hypothetical protein
MLIESPHGYLLDADEKVVLRFGNWEPGDYSVPAAVEAVEYVSGPGNHSRSVHWTYSDADAPVSLTLSASSIRNDGTDSVVVGVTLDAAADNNRTVTLSIDGSAFEKTLQPGTETTETITTTKSAGSVIEVAVDGAAVQSDTATITVVKP